MQPSQEDFKMARRRKMTPERKAFIDGLPSHYQPEDANDVQDMPETKPS